MDLVHFLLNIISITEIVPIIDILQFKEVSNVYYLSCNHRERIVYQKIFNDNNIRAAALDVNFGASYKMVNSLNTVGIVLDTSCNAWTEVLNYFPCNIAFKNPFKWLIFTHDLLATANVISNYSIEIDSDVTIVIKNRDAYELYEVFHTDYSKGVFTIKNVGYWNSTLNMEVFPRRDLTGVVIKTPVVITEKVVQETFGEYLSKPKKNQVDSLHKLKFYALLNYIKDIYNFR